MNRKTVITVLAAALLAGVGVWGWIKWAEWREAQRVAYEIHDAWNWYWDEAYDVAIGHFSCAMTPSAKDGEAYYGRGLAFIKKRLYAEALEDFEMAIKMGPEKAGAYHGRGAARHAMGDYDAAIRDYDKAIELDPTFTTAYTDRSKAYEAKSQQTPSKQDEGK